MDPLETHQSLWSIFKRRVSMTSVIKKVSDLLICTGIDGTCGSLLSPIRKTATRVLSVRAYQVQRRYSHLVFCPTCFTPAFVATLTKDGRCSSLRSRDGGDPSQCEGVARHSIYWIYDCISVSLDSRSLSGRLDLLNFSYRLYGISCLQTYLYYRHYQKDPWYLKLTVRILSLVSLLSAHLDG